MRSRLFLLFLTATLGLCSALAQNVRWNPPGGYLARGQTAELSLIFENCEPDGDLTLPHVPGITWGQPQPMQHTSSQFANNRVVTQRLLLYTFRFIPTSAQTIEIPAFTVATDKGNFGVAAARFEIREATVGETNVPISSVAQSTIGLERNEVWAGEVFPLRYGLGVSSRYRFGLGSNPDWKPAPLVIEEFGEPLVDDSTDPNRNFVVYSTRGYINQPGEHVIPSAQQLLNIGIPSAGLFNRVRTEQYAITSNAPTITVKPLPNGAPADFAGAVGDFRLLSRVVPETAAVGEPVTWTLELVGTGNWPDIPGLPSRSASNTFRVVQPDAKRQIAEGKLFEGSITEDVVLIPTTPGDFTLGPVSWTYFDPTSGSYQTLTTEAVTLSVAPATTPVPVGSVPGTAPAPPVTGPPTITATPAPDSPGALPLEPLPGNGHSAAPWTRDQLITAAIGLVLLLPLIWLGLSARRARLLDEGRPARLARRRLGKTLAAMPSAGAVTRDRLLLAWQQDSARLWQGTPATPLRLLFDDKDDWVQLWQECERALYAESAELPADWTDRARTALSAKPAPRFPLSSIVALRHLLPALAITAASLLATPDLSAQNTDAYRSGDYATAEAEAREALVPSPSDWVAHHNLALALAQQNRWEEAGAHAAVAFAQQPRHPSTRWHLNYVLERCGYTPPVIGRFLNPGWPEQIAWQASVSQWQLIFLGGLALSVVSLLLVLLAAYDFRVPARRFLTWSGGLSGVLLMAAALFSLQVWGFAAEPRAALTWQPGELRSIPTDLDHEQQTTALAAGSLCRVEKSFLGWRQVSFPNGQTGWLRAEMLVPVWKNQN